MFKVLSIAGSDSSAGAGVQADLKTFSALGVYGCTALTAVTAQNTQGVRDYICLDAALVKDQIEAVMADVGADAAKTGMLPTSEVIRVVADAVGRYQIPKLVVDPVLVATSGDALVTENTVVALREHLFPVAYMITPNMDEASALCGMRVESREAMEEAAQRLRALGAARVVVKGGHLPEEATDLYSDGTTAHWLPTPRVPVEKTHGTGCAFSAAIAAYLARGYPDLAAVERAKEFVTAGLRSHLRPGKGAAVPDSSLLLFRDAQQFRLVQEALEVVRKLSEARLGRLIPEVQSNLALALDGAVSADDVVAFPGRMVGVGDAIRTVGPPHLGASRHVARIVLTAMRYHPGMRAVMNVRYDPDLLRRAEALGFHVGSFRREEEPPDVREREGSSLEWGTQSVIQRLGRVPDLIADEGAPGKEAMIRVVAPNASRLLEMILQLAGG